MEHIDYEMKLVQFGSLDLNLARGSARITLCATVERPSTKPEIKATTPTEMTRFMQLPSPTS